MPRAQAPPTHQEISRRGGLARSAKLTKARRVAIARQAALTRWEKAKTAQTGARLCARAGKQERNGAQEHNE